MTRQKLADTNMTVNDVDLNRQDLADADKLANANKLVNAILSRIVESATMDDHLSRLSHEMIAVMGGIAKQRDVAMTRLQTDLDYAEHEIKIGGLLSYCRPSCSRLRTLQQANWCDECECPCHGLIDRS